MYVYIYIYIYCLFLVLFASPPVPCRAPSKPAAHGPTWLRLGWLKIP